MSNFRSCPSVRPYGNRTKNSVSTRSNWSRRNHANIPQIGAARGWVCPVRAKGLGGMSIFLLILMLALPPQLAAADDVHRTTSAMLTIGYSCAVIVPVFSGLAWDVAGLPAMAFAPVLLCALLLIAISATTCRRLRTVADSLAVAGISSHQ